MVRRAVLDRGLGVSRGVPAPGRRSTRRPRTGSRSSRSRAWTASIRTSPSGARFAIRRQAHEGLPPGLLRLLRLALVGPRPLDARSPGGRHARDSLRGGDPRRSRKAPFRRGDRGRGRLPRQAGGADVRAALWLGLGPAARGGPGRIEGPAAKSERDHFKPLEDAIVARFHAYLPKLTLPIRSGVHQNTAFALALALDYARATDRKDFEKILQSRASFYYGQDRACPLSYEPSGEDFLSPCLAEADLMRRVLSPSDFSRWLKRFLPQLSPMKTFPLSPEVVTDPTDPRLVHLDGLNLSRAWMLKGIAVGPSGVGQAPHRAAEGGGRARDGGTFPRRIGRLLRRPLARDVRGLPPDAALRRHGVNAAVSDPPHSLPAGFV